MVLRSREVWGRGINIKQPNALAGYPKRSVCAVNGTTELLNSCLVEFDQIGYRTAMSMLLRQIARYVAQKAASNPEAKEKAIKAAHDVVDGAKQIAKEDDRAYAAGRACRRTFDKLLTKR